MSTKQLIDYKILGKNIKDARERLGKTQSEIADSIHIIVSTYGKFERGILKPNLERLLTICSTLHIDMIEILRGALIVQIETSNKSPTNDEYLQKFQALLDKCHKQETISTMISVCSEIIRLENSK